MTNHARIMTLAQLCGPEPWRAELPHSYDRHALIWITRGQGICLVDGVRRGLGVHTALCVPAATLCSLELGKQGFGLACLVPAGGPILMPDRPVLLRIRDALAQAELNGILDAMQREENAARPFMDEALNAQASLLTVWLRRAIIDFEDETENPTTAQRLVMAYAALIERDHTTGKAMSDYARALGVTPTHLTRTCRACAGVTASELLTKRTLWAVRDLLETTDFPANRVAAMLGFRSAAYFSRFVLHHTGATPSALRKRKDFAVPPGPSFAASRP